MRKEIWFVIGGLVAFFLSTLFIPQGISDFARAAARDTAVPPGAGWNLAIGALLIAIAITLLARGYILRRRNPNATRTHDED